MRRKDGRENLDRRKKRNRGGEDKKDRGGGGEGAWDEKKEKLVFLKPNSLV